MYYYSLSAPPPATELHKVKAAPAKNASTNSMPDNSAPVNDSHNGPNAPSVSDVPNVPPPQQTVNSSQPPPRVIVKPSPNFKLNAKGLKSQGNTVSTPPSDAPPSGQNKADEHNVKKTQRQTLKPLTKKQQPKANPDTKTQNNALNNAPPHVQTKVSGVNHLALTPNDTESSQPKMRSSSATTPRTKLMQPPSTLTPTKVQAASPKSKMLQTPSLIPADTHSSQPKIRSSSVTSPKSKILQSPSLTPTSTQPLSLTPTKMQSSSKTSPKTKLMQPPSTLTPTKVQTTSPKSKTLQAPPTSMQPLSLTPTKVQPSSKAPPKTKLTQLPPSFASTKVQATHPSTLTPTKLQQQSSNLTPTKVKTMHPPLATTAPKTQPPSTLTPTKVQIAQPPSTLTPTKVQIAQPPSTLTPTTAKMQPPSSLTQTKMQASQPPKLTKIQTAVHPDLTQPQQSSSSPTQIKTQLPSPRVPKIQTATHPDIVQPQASPSSPIAAQSKQQQQHQTGVQFMGAYRAGLNDSGLSNSEPTLPSYTESTNPSTKVNPTTKTKSTLGASDVPLKNVSSKLSRRHLAMKYDAPPLEFLVGNVKNQPSLSPLSASSVDIPPPPISPQPKVVLNLSKEEEEELAHARAYLQQYKSQIEIQNETAESSNNEMKSIGNCARMMSANESEYCMLCGKGFTMILRRHNCLKCGKLFCSDCTAWSIEQPELNSKGPIRVCAQCYCSHIESGGAQTLFAASKGAQIRIEEGEDVKAKTLAEEEPKVQSIVNEKVEEQEKLPEDKEERMRYRCIHEVITTEKTYVEDLKTLITVYMYPIKLTGILSQEQADGIFSNIEMLEPVHSELLQKLTDDEYTKGGEYIGEAFKSICQYLKMYTLYCANHENATKIIEGLKGNAEFQKTLTICQTDPRTKGENLASYIIKPIQRICKYPLFFREIISHTSPDHSDYQLLIETKERIDDVVKAINEGKRRLEQQQKMVEILNSVDGSYEGDGLITPFRIWIEDIKLQGHELSASRVVECMIFLFNDLILVTKVTGSKKFQLKMYIPLNEAVITDVADNEKIKNCFELSRKNHDTRYQFFVESDDKKASIVKLLKTTQNEIKKMILTGKMLGQNSQI